MVKFGQKWRAPPKREKVGGLGYHEKELVELNNMGTILSGPQCSHKPEV
jgi:hypothetical protein